MLDWAHGGFMPKGQEGLKPRENPGEYTSSSQKHLRSISHSIHAVVMASN